jgi:prenyltransferase beta subunit
MTHLPKEYTMKRFGLILLGVVVCLAPVDAQTTPKELATIDYVHGLQTERGGFRAAAADKDKASLRATSSAWRALKYFDAHPKDVKAAAAFIESCFDKSSGGFADTPGGKPDVFSTAVGGMAVVEANLPLEKYADAVVKYLDENAKTFEEIRIAAAGLETIQRKSSKANAWLEQVAKMRNEDGTYGKGEGVARETGGAVVVVLRLGGKVAHPENVLKTLKAGQRSDGGFGKADAKSSDLETTYRVMRAFWMMKERPDVAKLRGFIARCRNADGGYGVAPGQPSSVSGTYFAAVVTHWLDEK